MNKRFVQLTLAAGLAASLTTGGWGWHPSRDVARAAPPDCSGSLTISASSGQLSDSSQTRTVSATASGLPANTIMYVNLFDANGRTGQMYALGAPSTDGTGKYSGSLQLPFGGVAGGTGSVVISAGRCLRGRPVHGAAPAGGDLAGHHAQLRRDRFPRQ